MRTRIDSPNVSNVNVGPWKRFKPFTCIIAGPTGSVSRHFACSFYKTPALCTEQRFKGRILWCFSERTSIPTGELDALNLNIRYHEGVPVDFKNPRGEPCLFILNDLLDDPYSSGLVCDLFTKGSHRNNRVVLITLKIFHQSKHCRDISLNAKHLVLFKNVRDLSQFSRLDKCTRSMA